jgi:AcrR family transcriptional regulator
MSDSPQPAVPVSFGQDWSARRSDARRNHERIIIAALEVFSERGLEATMPDVAKRAGVGKATVYRSYATKAELIAAVADYQMRWMEDRVAAALEDPDPYAALRSFFGDLAERLCGDRVLADVVPKGFEARNRQVMASIGALLDAAKEQGGIGPDVTVQDFRVLVGGATRQLVAMEIRDPSVWRHYSELIIRALSR